MSFDEQMFLTLAEFIFINYSFLVSTMSLFKKFHFCFMYFLFMKYLAYFCLVFFF